MHREHASPIVFLDFTNALIYRFGHLAIFPAAHEMDVNYGENA
jgi:hypothetical protein